MLLGRILSCKDYIQSQLAVIATILVSVLIGLVASTGSVQLVTLFLTICLSTLLFSKPIYLQWIVLLGGTVFSGLLILYAPAIQQARWGVVIAATFLGAVAVFHNTFQNSYHFTSSKKIVSSSVWALMFAAISFVSAIVNNGLSLNSLIGLKGYFQVWGLLLAFSLLPLTMKQVDRIMGSLLWLCLIQLPFILHQHLLLVPARIGLSKAAKGLVAQDVVVGTFAASMTGGGARSSLALLLTVALAIAVAKWRTGKIKFLTLTVFFIACLAPFALNGLKLGMLSAPLALSIVYSDQIRSNKTKFLCSIIISVFVMLVLFVLVSMLPRTGGGPPLTVDRYFSEWVSYNFKERGYGNSALNRTTVYPFWLKYHQSEGGLINTMIGYGPGTANGSNLMEQSLGESRYARMGIDLTGASELLWEVGIIGLTVVCGFIISSYRSALRLVHIVPFGSSIWVFLKSAQVGIAFSGISLLHNNTFLYEIGFQTLLMLIVGYVFYINRMITCGMERYESQYC